MARVTEAAHVKGVLTVWDLSHSAGAVPVDVKGADNDFAIGCGYKYLCAGPGGPAYIYAKPELADAVWPALAGWMGHADVYAFARDFEPHPGVKRFLAGTPLVGANELASACLTLAGSCPEFGPTQIADRSADATQTGMWAARR
jgi:kynureninase